MKAILTDVDANHPDAHPGEYLTGEVPDGPQSNDSRPLPGTGLPSLDSADSAPGRFRDCSVGEGEAVRLVIEATTLHRRENRHVLREPAAGIRKRSLLKAEVWTSQPAIDAHAAEVPEAEHRLVARSERRDL